MISQAIKLFKLLWPRFFSWQDVAICHNCTFNHLIIPAHSKPLSDTADREWWCVTLSRFEFVQSGFWWLILLKFFLHISNKKPKREEKSVISCSYLNFLRTYWPICHFPRQPINHRCNHPFSNTALRPWCHSNTSTSSILHCPISFLICLPLSL